MQQENRIIKFAIILIKSSLVPYWVFAWTSGLMGIFLISLEDILKSFNANKAEAFSEKLLTALNYGSLSLMMSIGHRTGIFDAMRALPPSTSEEVAKACGGNERYVREWLGAMVTAGVIDVDPTSTRYTLPAEHAAILTRAAGADNFAVFTQYIGLLGSVEDKIVECFKKGGGVPPEVVRLQKAQT